MSNAEMFESEIDDNEMLEVEMFEYLCLRIFSLRISETSSWNVRDILTKCSSMRKEMTSLCLNQVHI